jgi:peptidoglycan/LPS O-acetylase OafA/YrhL
VGLVFVQEAAYLLPLPIAYMTVYMGLLNPPKNFLIRSADYSYGVYLYGFPVQQAVAYLFPDQRAWYVHLPASLLVAGVWAALSWHLVEKPINDRRKAVLALVARINPMKRPQLAAPSA